jgi:hypothetical protein
MGWKMKKYTLALALLLAAASPVFALGVVDAMTCKRVVLHEANDRTVLVDRMTGEVKYALRYNGEWEHVQGARKDKYQSIYNAQVRPKKQ